MKLKKVLILLLVFCFIPTFVLAKDECDTSKIFIKSVESIESTYTTEETYKEVLASEMNLNLLFLETGDYVQYKLVVENDSNEDFAVNFDDLGLSSKYLIYEFSTEDLSNVIKAGTSKEILLTVTYQNAVPEDEKDEGVFYEEQAITLKLMNEEYVGSNPLTSPNMNIVVIALVVIALTLLIKKKVNSKYLIIVFALLFIPYGVRALCSKSLVINVNSKIRDCYHLVTDKGSFSEDEIIQDICFNLVDDGYTFSNPIFSSFYVPRDPVESDVVIIPDFTYDQFTDSSFIRFYSDSSKSNLLAELTKDSFPGERYAITRAYVSNFLAKMTISLKMPDVLAYDGVYVELSSDFNIPSQMIYFDDCNQSSACNYQEPFGFKLYRKHIYYSTYYAYPSFGTYVYSGPWITNSNVIHKIDILVSNVDSEYRLNGFVPDENNPRVYRAQWELNNSIQ